jgi:hypothetical protein
MFDKPLGDPDSREEPPSMETIDMTFQDYIEQRKRDLQETDDSKLQEQIEVEAMVLLRQDLLNAVRVASSVSLHANGKSQVSMQDVLQVYTLMQTYSVIAYRSLLAKGEIERPVKEEAVEIPITVNEVPPSKGSN